jgi:hypothetical protein
MTVHHSAATDDPAVRAQERESVSAGAAGLGALGSVIGLGVASTTAAPVIGLVAGVAAGAGLGYIINRVWSSPPVETYRKDGKIAWPPRP